MTSDWIQIVWETEHILIFLVCDNESQLEEHDIQVNFGTFKCNTNLGVLCWNLDLWYGSLN